MSEHLHSASAPITLDLLSPRGVFPSVSCAGLTNPRPADLSGKIIALLADKPMAALFLDLLAELLQQRYSNLTFVRFPSSDAPDNPDNTAEIAAACDLWIQGIKTSGLSPVDAEVKLEKLGRPGVALTADNLLEQRQWLAADAGLPTLRIVGLPTDSIFACENRPEKVRLIVDIAFDSILQALTRPLSDSEKHPQQPTHDYSPIGVTGDDYTQALENFQRYAAEHKMGDGLPLIPPTPEAVRWMLSGTTRSPNEEIGRLATRFGLATIHQIAVNSVMAGARPEYLPVIIAAVECLTDPGFNQYHLLNSAASPSALIWVNGPLAAEIGMNSGLGYLGPGCRATAAIGRAISLCEINIGWRSFGGVSNLTGAPEGYCNLIFPENEVDSPWESFAVEQGFGPLDSTVTINEVFYYNRFGPGTSMASLSTERMLNDLADIIAGMKMGGSNSKYCHIVLYPAFARQLAAAGYTKQSLKQWLCQHSRLPWDKLGPEPQKAARTAAQMGKIPGLRLEDCQPGGSIPVFTNPAHMAILVAGNMGGYTVVYHSAIGSTVANASHHQGAPTGVNFITKRIRGAALTRYGR
jgi:hypothetical protein